MKTLILFFSIFLMGCETLQQPEIPQPDKTAVYHTANGTTTEANTEWENYIDKCYYDETIESGVYYAGNNQTVKWTRE